MIIRLQHSQTTLKTTAAFIRGTSPLAWLQEISRWKIAPQHLSCYILPQSLQSPSPAGLFVIIYPPAVIGNELLLNPYGSIAGKLYIPVDSKLYPECTTAELQKMLIWDVQVFHPTIGLVGFDKKDALSLPDLLQDVTTSSLAWNGAHPGLPSRPSLQQIQVIQPTPESLLEDIKKELDTKPLDEILGAKDGKLTMLEKAWDAAKYGLFKGMFATANTLQKAFQMLPAGTNSNVDFTGSGWLEKWRKWLSKNIEHLEKKRQDEIQRLLSMFEEDSDEALQYAIPLDSSYLNRGKATPTASLTKRPLNFNLGKLGGGGAVDGWDIGDHYSTLRTKYVAAAQAQVEKGDFKKVAYIYAHLLNDFQSAANVLAQGKYYREAAALYKDHLRNVGAAAECLENGGLTTEAIELYKELDKTEKVGDLYKLLEQEKQAEIYFEKTVKQYLKVNNHLEAARVLQDKKREDNRAKEILLEGWLRKEQPENCLQQYFNIVDATEPDKMRYYIDKIYKDASDAKQPQFLNVLYHLRLRADKELASHTTEIAYEIVSRKAAANDMSLLPQLKQFVPGDKLLAPDISRYIHKRPKPVKKEEDWTLQLDDTIQWEKAVAFRNQVIVAGRKDKHLHIIRFNWYKDTEYVSFVEEVTGRINQLVASPYETNVVLITGAFNYHIWDHRFLKNKYFSEEVIVQDLGHLPSDNAGLTFIADGDVAVLDGGSGNPFLHYYTADGKLKKSVTCQPVLKEALRFHNSAVAPPLVHYNGMFITATSHYIVAVEPNGNYTYFNAGSVIRMYAASKLSPNLKMIVSTNAGCLIGQWIKGEPYLHTHVFATDSIPSVVEFIAADRFVLAEKNTISVYDISEQNLAVFIRTIEVSSKVIAVVSSSIRGKFAVIEETGFVSLHDI